MTKIWTRLSIGVLGYKNGSQGLVSRREVSIRKNDEKHLEIKRIQKAVSQLKSLRWTQS